MASFGLKSKSYCIQFASDDDSNPCREQCVSLDSSMAYWMPFVSVGYLGSIRKHSVSLPDSSE